MNKMSNECIDRIFYNLQRHKTGCVPLILLSKSLPQGIRSPRGTENLFFFFRVLPFIHSSYFVAFATMGKCAYVCFQGLTPFAVLIAARQSGATYVPYMLGKYLFSRQENGGNLFLGRGKKVSSNKDNSSKYLCGPKCSYPS